MAKKKRPIPQLVAVRVLFDPEDFKLLDRRAKERYRGKWATAVREIVLKDLHSEPAKQSAGG